MHPVWFELFGYPVHLYAVMIACGFVVGIWLAARYGQRAGLDREMILDLCWWLLVGGLVGARIAFIAVEWEQYYWPCVDYQHFNSLYPDDAITEADCTRLLRFWNGGLVYYGGAIGGILTMFWFMRREGQSVWPVADALIPSLAIGQFFGRLGCLAAGCCWGAPTGDHRWALFFPPKSMPYYAQYKEGLITGHEAHALPIHAVQLYDALAGLALFVLLVWIRQRKRYHGQVFVWWMFLYPLQRSLIELFRGDAERGFIFEVVAAPLNQLLGLPEGTITFLSTSQFISLGVVAAAGAILYHLRRRQPATAPPAPTPTTN